METQTQACHGLPPVRVGVQVSMRINGAGKLALFREETSVGRRSREGVGAKGPPMTTPLCGRLPAQEVFRRQKVVRVFGPCSGSVWLLRQVAFSSVYVFLIPVTHM